MITQRTTIVSTDTLGSTDIVIDLFKERRLTNAEQLVVKEKRIGLAPARQVVHEHGRNNHKIDS